MGDFEGEGGGNRKKIIRPFLCALKFSFDCVRSEFENSQKWRRYRRKSENFGDDVFTPKKGYEDEVPDPYIGYDKVAGTNCASFETK